jgi:hypothetical protein
MDCPGKRSTSKGFGNIHPEKIRPIYSIMEFRFCSNSSLMRMSIIREGLIGISFQYKSINLEKQADT